MECILNKMLVRSNFDFEEEGANKTIKLSFNNKFE
jgi:hypothetical protein